MSGQVVERAARSRERPFGRDRRDGERQTPAPGCRTLRRLGGCSRCRALRGHQLLRRREEIVECRGVLGLRCDGTGRWRGTLRHLTLLGRGRAIGSDGALLRCGLRSRWRLGTGIRHARVHRLVLDGVVAVALEVRILGRAIVDVIRAAPPSDAARRRRRLRAVSGRQQRHLERRLDHRHARRPREAAAAGTPSRCSSAESAIASAKGRRPLDAFIGARILFGEATQSQLA